MKICPQCQQPNRVSAQFCAHCGHTFATQTGGAAAPRALYGAGAVALVLVIAVFGAWLVRRATAPPPPATAAPPAASTPTRSTPAMLLPPAAGLDRALLATVQILVPVDGSHEYAVGSGSVLTAKGHILTNLHVLVNETTGQFNNDKETIFIAVNAPGLKDPPQIRYLAQVVRRDDTLDLALLKIVARQDGGNLPADLGLTTMPIGDSDTVLIGDEISIIGFPGLGGSTVTFTRGSVSGFLTDEGWIKTDAEINPGNSGGAAIDHTGNLVAIPTMVTTESQNLPGKIGLVRPVKLARPLIDWALQDAGG
jgi:S1-C subfamily serine protease